VDQRLQEGGVYCFFVFPNFLPDKRVDGDSKTQNLADWKSDLQFNGQRVGSKREKDGKDGMNGRIGEEREDKAILGVCVGGKQ
jgi:hypothetical protein